MSEFRQSFVKAVGYLSLAAMLSLSAAGDSYAQGRGSVAPDGPPATTETVEEAVDDGLVLEIDRAGIIEADNYVHPELAVDSEEPVGICWIIALDNSSSLTDDEYQGQLDGLASVFRSDNFRETIFSPGAPGSAAIAIVDFGSDSALMMPWVHFYESDREKFRQFADMVQTLPRRAEGGTMHHRAMNHAAIAFDALPQDCGVRHVIIMTDGTGDQQSNRTARALLANGYGATVSAMITKTGSNSAPYSQARGSITTPGENSLLILAGPQLTGPDGNTVGGGITINVASEVQSASTGNVLSLRGRIMEVFLDHLTIQTGYLMQPPSAPWHNSPFEQPETNYG